MAAYAPAFGLAHPSATRLSALAARILALVVLALVAAWVSLLGGLAAGADDGGKTGRLFNWHPLLMTLAYVVFMTEALLSYRAPWAGGGGASVPRPRRKLAHASCHALAAACAAGGLAAAWRSHTLASPPIPNLYSPHSFVGMAALTLFGLQAAAGLYAYVCPGAHPSARAALSPLHRFLGAAAYAAGLAAAASGLQEKATFLQLGGGGKGVFSAYLRLPAWAAAALLPLGLLTLWPQAAGADAGHAVGGIGGLGGSDGSSPAHRALPTEEEAGGFGGALRI